MSGRIHIFRFEKGLCRGLFAAFREGDADCGLAMMDHTAFGALAKLIALEKRIARHAP